MSVVGERFDTGIGPGAGGVAGAKNGDQTPQPALVGRYMRRQMLGARDALDQVGRMRNQASEEERSALADTVILNDGSQLVIPQVLALHERLLKQTQG